MRAVIFSEFGVRPEVREAPDPEPAPDGVVIEVEATGVCRSDWHSWQGHDPGVALPHVAGHEPGGRIAALGVLVSGWQVGDRVTVPFVCACGSCAECASGNQQICDRQFQPGATHWGSFAEFVAVDYAETNLVALPQDLSSVHAAALGCRFATAFRALLRQGNVRTGQWVAVYGCGGAGISAVMLAVAAGAQVVAVDLSMLETIRQFGEEQLVASGEAATVRSAHARHFAKREADILAQWDSPRQREAYDWFATELANQRSAFRWAADHNDLDVAATIAAHAGLIGALIEKIEPVAWAEEVIEPARAADHPLLPVLYAIASQCWMAGRIDEGVRYTDAARIVLTRRRDTLPYPFDGIIGGAYMASGHPERWIEWCRAQLQRGGDTTALIQACLVFGLVNAGSGEEAMDASKGLIEAAEAAANPMSLAFALYADGFAFREVDPARALDAVRRGLIIAQDSGNRLSETQLALTLGRLAADHSDIASAFDHLTLAIRNTHDAGDTTNIKNPLAAVAALFDRLGRHESAATIAGFALSPLTALAIPELNTAIAHLRDVLGDQTYESLARKGETMTTAAVATYAYDQIDQARAELNAVS